jgi:hypothetical protein
MQLGHTLPRILQRIAYANPAHGPPLLLKLDLSNGYYHIQLSPEAALELAVVLPGISTTGHLIAVPLSLPMGWMLSPPYFCAFYRNSNRSHQCCSTVSPNPTRPTSPFGILFTTILRALLPMVPPKRLLPRHT